MSEVDAATGTLVRDMIAHHAFAFDNHGWAALDEAYVPGARLGGPTGELASIDAMKGTLADDRVYHPHHTSDTILHRVDARTIRAWSKYFIVRGDGTAGSGDYLDTIVLTGDGWRIAERRVSRGSRPASDPDGPSTRTFDIDLWLRRP